MYVMTIVTKIFFFWGGGYMASFPDVLAIGNISSFVHISCQQYCHVTDHVTGTYIASTSSNGYQKDF